MINQIEPEIRNDDEIDLIYVFDLVNDIINKISQKEYRNKTVMKPLKTIRVSELLYKLKNYYNEYFLNKIIPNIEDHFDLCLFKSFRSYIGVDFFPVFLIKKTDDRGFYSEIVKTNNKGQVSYSITKRMKSRGNHFHLRKIERFTVLSGIGLLKLRKFGTDFTPEYILDGNHPTYFDIPVCYLHSLTNIGDNELITLFWTNELFDVEDSDTYFDKV